MKNIIKKFNINIVITILLVVLTLFLIGVVAYFDILPLKYFIAITLFLVILVLIIIYKIISKKTLKKTKKIFYILAVIFSILVLVISFFIIKTKNLLNSGNIDYKTHNYSVIVLKKSDYKKITDLKNASMGYYDNNAEGLEDSIEKISGKTVVSMIPYSNLEELGYALLSGEVDSIIIDDSYKAILENEEDNSERLKDFKSLTKTIYSFNIKTTQKNIIKDVDVTTKPFAVYISGIDTYGDISSVSCSDVNMLLVINPSTHQILLVSIPRDYYVQLHGTTGYKDKLTHAGSYGIEMSVQTIEDLLDVDINYYLKVNFTSLINIVDSLGGVDVYSEYTFTSIEGYHYTEGYNSVNGIEALWFARERKAFLDGDRQRGRDQQALIDAIFRKATNKSIITKYNSLLNSIEGSFTTNMSSSRITSLIKMQLSNNVNWSITSTSLDGTDSSNYTYTYNNQLLYVMEPNLDSISAAQEMINQVYNGSNLTSSYQNESSDIHQVEKYDPIYYDEGTSDTTNETTEPIVTHIVYFDSNGGSVVSNQTVEDGKLATNPTTSREGYIFLGWYDSNNQKYDFNNNSVTTDINLKAVWELAEDSTEEK